MFTYTIKTKVNDDGYVFNTVRRADPTAVVELIEAGEGYEVYEVTTERDVARILDLSEDVLEYEVEE